MLTTEDDNDDQPYESSQMSGLIISKGGVYSFFSHREVTQYETFWAAGSGTDYALGVLDALYNSDLDATSIAEAAVETACRFDSASGLPLESYQVELH